MYFPKRLLLSFRVVFAFPMAWGTDKDQNGKKKKKKAVICKKRGSSFDRIAQQEMEATKCNHRENVFGSNMALEHFGKYAYLAFLPGSDQQVDPTLLPVQLM